MSQTRYQLAWKLGETISTDRYDRAQQMELEITLERPLTSLEVVKLGEALSFLERWAELVNQKNTPAPPLATFRRLGPMTAEVTLDGGQP